MSSKLLEIRLTVRRESSVVFHDKLLHNTVSAAGDLSSPAREGREGPLVAGTGYDAN